jgi:hypothetical protein
VVVVVVVMERASSNGRHGAARLFVSVRGERCKVQEGW